VRDQTPPERSNTETAPSQASTPARTGAAPNGSVASIQEGYTWFIGPKTNLPKRVEMRTPATILIFCLATGPAAAQGGGSFQNAPAQIPSGGPFNNSTSENVDFADVDLDGDLDVVFADGGSSGNDRNRVWINQGGLQAGTMGFFVDDTGARIPPGGADSSRDVDFVDFDGDGDPDLYISNDSSHSNQSCRFWVNMGGVQGGTAGFFQDESSTRWVNVGVNDGTTTFSSVAPAFVYAPGGFIDWSFDGLFGDFDGDGDMDLLHSAWGPSILVPPASPARLFLNDGAGYFEEFNPSGFQSAGLGLADGDPALWASGVQADDTLLSNGTESDIVTSALAVELGDLDGDFDLDILLGDALTQPRLFRNELVQNGGVLTSWRDVTGAAFAQLAGSGNYEQELGDFDNDNDLDLYGLDWTSPASSDVTIRGDGQFGFGTFTALPTSSASDIEGDFFDYDGDGALDLFIPGFPGQDRLYQNAGAPGYAFADVTASEMPSSTDRSLGADSADVDGDGDSDLMVANDNSLPNRLLINTTNVADTSAPRVVLEQVGDPGCGATQAVAIRAHVYDNQSWDVTRYNTSVIEYSVNGAPVVSVPMAYAGGQLWHGEIPALTGGAITYTVKSTDPVGNTGASATLGYTVTPSPVSYCTAGTSAGGCQALLTSTGVPSASAPSGFVLVAAGAEGGKNGLVYFGTAGRTAQTWGSTSSYKCVASPTRRGELIASGGTAGACDGTFSYDLNARWQQIPSQNPGAGAVVQAQLWYRDPQSAGNPKTAFSDALELTVCP
jgi:hypothetical protein